MSANVPYKVRAYLTQHETVTVDELKGAADISERSARSYLSRLAGSGEVTRIGKGRYTLREAQSLPCQPTPNMQEVGNLLANKLMNLEPVVWSTDYLAPYAHYAVGRSVTFVEVPSRFVNLVTDVLINAGKSPLLYSGGLDLGAIQHLFEHPMVIVPRTEKYATFKDGGYRVPYLERTIIDHYYLSLHGSLPFPPDEIGRLLFNMLSTSYAFNFERCLRYASRRGIRNEILILLFRFSRDYPQLKIPDSLFFANKKVEAEMEELIKGAIS